MSNAINPCNINHIAFIMDGNGRWAKKRLMPREYGHVECAKNFKKLVRHCGDVRGIKCITVYAFSTENWKRPQAEVSALMKLFRQYIQDAKEGFIKDDFHLVFIGNRDIFSEDIRREMDEVERDSASCSRTLCVAVNYGGRAEVVDAVNKLIASGKTSITEDDITQNIYSGVVPPPDAIVRTGGEVRLSNFLMWQSAYSELFFTDTLWPDFSIEELDAIIDSFGQRDRRFGGVKV